MSQYRINEHRIYEGEWYFGCDYQVCNGFLIEYALNDYENLASNFLYNTPLHVYERCHLCGRELEWGGYSGGSPITDSLVSLLKNNHYMASTVILSAIIENALNNLLWAALVDNKVDKNRANKIADGGMSRFDTIKMIRSLTNLQVKDISFPIRNLVAHGKGLTQSESFYKSELKKQVEQIRSWVGHILKDKHPSNFMPSECERWRLFMDHWSNWLVSYTNQNVFDDK